LDFGEKITVFYYEDRYPPGPIPEISEEEAKETLEKGEKIIELIKKDTEL
jgi:HEPN domain-containing protein